MDRKQEAVSARVDHKQEVGVQEWIINRKLECKNGS